MYTSFLIKLQSIEVKFVTGKLSHIRHEIVDLQLRGIARRSGSFFEGSLNARVIDFGRQVSNHET